nr:23S rRNA (uracil(1939)-C(5))-methyltransferase RlmD [Lachnospiraceae bacterium]
MKKNDIFELHIEDLTAEGAGIGKLDGFPFFVKGALPGDFIHAGVTKLKKTYGFARMVDIIEPSKDRVEPKCPVARRCGGCQLQALSYEAEIKYKANKVKNNLIRIGGFDADFISSIEEPALSAPSEFRYRNKAQYPVGYDKNGEPVAGFYANHSHDIIPCTDCLLGVEENEKILNVVLSWMKENGISAYDEEKHAGVVRHVLIRKGFATGEIMVCLSVNAKSIKASDKLIEALKDIPGMTHISISPNEKKTNVIMGEESKTLWGRDFIVDKIGDLSFEISPLSFFQVNPVQMKNLYDKAKEYAALTGTETVWDLYCGAGTISLYLARDAKEVTGVEIVPQAIENAKKNAARNGIENAKFFCGAAEDLVHGDGVSGSFSSSHPDVIVVDPPRKGCDAKLIDTILEITPDRIVYVSCDSATLARDLKLLAEGGYELRRFCPTDMFAKTSHVETV